MIIMEILHAIILGLIQGLTEFIPVSSSGHLILVREVLHLPETGGLAFDAVLQLATALAVLIYFVKEIPQILRNKRLLLALVIGTIPAVIAGLTLESFMETTFRSAHLVAWMLLMGAGLMWWADRSQTLPLDKGEMPKAEGIGPMKGLVIGLFQCLALVPGVSRSGATISGGLFAGLSREEATKFSFLLSIPIIMGSGAKELLSLGTSGALNSLGLSLFIASIVALISGYWSVRFLLNYLKTHSLKPFIWYRIAMALIILTFL